MVLVTGLSHLIFGLRIWKHSLSDVLILAAHQDDCVVLAGEYALWALNAGKSVTVVYLTSGAEDPKTLRAQTRSREALEVWAYAGVPEQNLHFLGYKQSEVNGACANSPSELLEANTKIEDIVRKAEVGTCIFVPAEGESHVDHREIRRIGLQAIKQSGRSDLSVFEAPEYNMYFSLIHSPGKALRYFSSILPLNSRFSHFFNGSYFPGYVRGGRAFQLPFADAIHRKKLEMLRMFTSENGELLVKYFGWRNQFRPVQWLPLTREESFGIRYVKVGEKRIGLTLVGLFLSFYLLSFGITWQFSQWLTDYLAGILGVSLVIICMLALFYSAFRGKKQIETQLFYVIGGLGMITELLIRMGR